MDDALSAGETHDGGRTAAAALEKAPGRPGRPGGGRGLALAEAQQKLESLAADIQQFVLQVGNDKVTADARAGTAAERLEDLAVEINKVRVAAAE